MGAGNPAVYLQTVNLLHRRYCRSDGWRRVVHRGMMPWVLRDVDLGANVLEIGPGPGVTTDWLRERVPALTCVEIDPRLASSLKRRLEGENVTVAEGDATQMSFADASFDSAVCFTMLHHVPSRELQDRLLTEACRVLKPGGLFLGSDSTSSFRFRLFHLFDTCVPIEPKEFGKRLAAAGFGDIEIGMRPEYNTFKFRARKA
jgi:ubiquinone/menaquinone biosynthesis C-methylase UbiE